MNSGNGQLLVDVAELDDLSGLLLFVILLTVIPILQENGTLIISQISTTIFLLVTKLTLFVGFCYFFAQYLESSFTRFNRRWADPKMGLTISVLGAGLAIAALAGYLGFSLAIGALFAGLAFGMQIDPTTISKSFSLATALILVAITGKIMGITLPALLKLPKRKALLLGISMVPRAEIAMLIVFQANLLGKEIISPELYAAMVLVAILTSIISPVLLRRLI